MTAKKTDTTDTDEDVTVVDGPTAPDTIATGEPAGNTSAATDPDKTADAVEPIACVAPMPCLCPPCVGEATEDNTVVREDTTTEGDKAKADDKATADKAAK